MLDIINSSTCLPSAPLMKLEENGTASVLNYNLPQSTSYSGISYVDMGIAESFFKPIPPKDNFWDRTKDLDLHEIVQLLLDEIDHASNDSLFGNSNLLYRLGVITKGNKRLLDAYLVHAAQQTSTNSGSTEGNSGSDGTGGTGGEDTDSTGDGDALDFLDDPIGHGDDHFRTIDGYSNQRISRTQDHTYNVITSNTTDTDAVLSKDLTQKLNDLNFTDLDYDIPSPYILRFYAVAGVPLFEIATKIKRGFKPILNLTPFGLVRLEFIPEPETLPPSLEIILHYKMANFLGDYGAGKTVKTLSLLPGERTTISIRSWKRNEITRKLAENILDSYSESSMDELQNIIEQESGNTRSSGSQASKNKNRSFNAGLNLTLDSGLGGSLKFNSTSDRTRSLNSTISNQIRNLANSTSKQTDKADALREIQVNVETSEITQTEIEETISRELENINKSRVLNFVFRQLLQEYISITYLDNVSLSYFNGEENIVVGLEEMDDFLAEFLLEDKIDEVKFKLLTYLCNIKDFEGNSKAFVEEVSETLSSCIASPTGFSPLTSKYIRKRQDLNMQYEVHNFHGIILDVTRRTIRTDAIIAESLLGYGDALDCYNIKLQNEAVREAILNNDEKAQALKIIEELDDPTLKATLYKKVYGDCCEVPQSGCGCEEK